MELLESILELVDTNLIKCIPSMILTLLLIRFLFVKRIEIKPALNIIKWIILTYTILGLLSYLIEILFIDDQSAFLNRATGRYWYAYWIMILSAVVLPFSLFYKKWGEKPFYIIFISIMMKIGWYFELMAIFGTSYHRDDLANGESFDWWILPLYGLLMIWLKSFVLVLILLGGVKLTERKGRRKTLSS